MAKKNKTGLIIGLAITAGAAWLLLKKPATTSAAESTAQPTAPYAPTSGTGIQPTSGSGSVLQNIINLGKSIFGGSSSSPSFTPVSTAPVVTTPVASPAGGINYINPTAPTISLPPAPAESVPGDVTDLDFTTDLFV